MGRLTKVKIDEIGKLRKQGYTQKETAQKVGVHVRTVRRYDPLYESRQSEKRSVEDRLAALEQALTASWDWIYLLYITILRSSPGLTSCLEEESCPCPRCNGKLEYDEDQYAHVCRDCGHKVFPPLFWCYHCLSQEKMDYIDATDEWTCPKCGAKRYSPNVWELRAKMATE